MHQSSQHTMKNVQTIIIAMQFYMHHAFNMSFCNFLVMLSAVDHVSYLNTVQKTLTVLLSSFKCAETKWLEPKESFTFINVL